LAAAGRARGPIVLDARDAFVAMPHGSGVYVKRLLEALRLRLPSPDALQVLSSTAWPGPEVVWEQVGLPRALRRQRAALVHGPDSFLPLRRSCPGVLTVHDLGFEAMPGDMPRLTSLKYRGLVRRCTRSAERVICPSEFTAADVERCYGVARERIRVIPEAPALPAGTLEPPAGRYLLAAGDLRPKKNLEVLVRAFAQLWEEGAVEHRLLLAGADLGSGGRLASLAGGAPVEFLGFVSDERLDALLRGAEALVVPSLYEGFGLVVLDAMIRGCPVVLARAGALPEVGADAALYFEAQDVSELRDLLRALLADRGERERLARAGRERAAGFSWERAAAATVAVYEELLGAG
jgi:glycosyltransferase involved in cell wall biosynthesis